ncbi:uncharacterized protein LOC131684438 [Topomyia yanbarensis]|uniref:uncharacterized protein LOC131684438 n=1 Tax=Topomyia yanbarensis TaxID=2498891 RepID=UPI00273BB6BB|nr:uncharacterized protein LOC131684438 [Topomyia yanbarensis]
MVLLIGLISYWAVSCAVAAPTVHLIKQEDSADIPDIQTDLPQIVDPLWMTVTMKPLVKTAVVKPISKSYQPPHETVNQNSPPQQPSYYPYYYQFQPASNPEPLYPYNTPQYQYQPGYQLQWPSVSTQPLVASQLFPLPLPQVGSNNPPCGDSGRNIGGYHQHGY